MRKVKRESIDRVGIGRELERIALAIDAPQHRVGELARAYSVTLLDQFDGLRDRRVRRHASHVEKLVDAGAQQVHEIRVEPNQPAAHPGVEMCVDD